LTNFKANTLGGVFRVDFKLNALQPYTNNRDLPRTAIERATAGNYTENGLVIGGR
jgi:hypothetical protein